MAEQWYKPGDKAPVSGVYIVAHHEHRPEHQATLLEGDSLPSCLLCGDKVRFRIAHTALAVRADADFSGG